MARSVRRRPMTNEQKAQVEDADYDTGFGKPPEAKRFKKGQSGNPSGRPKGARSMRTLLEELLDREVKVVIDGVSRQVGAKEAILHRLFVQAIKGKTQDADLFVRLIKHTLPEQFAEEADDQLNADEVQLLEAIATKMLMARGNSEEGQ